MSTFLSEAVQVGLDTARRERMRDASRHHLVFDDVDHPILTLWKTGFSMDADTAPQVRGFVDVYEDGVHLFQCLVVASEDGDHGERIFEFKRATAVSSEPPLDFVRTRDAPVALIGLRR